MVLIRDISLNNGIHGMLQAQHGAESVYCRIG